MLAHIEKSGNGYIAKFERNMKHSAEKVWAMLTDNEKLSQWFSELHVEELRAGGLIMFDLGDGTYEKIKILEVKPQSVLEYTWGEDIVRFELFAEQDSCRLIFIEKINLITNHTPKDLAGWHVCLNVIEHLLDGTEAGLREDAWSEWYKKYVQVISDVAGNEIK